MAVDTQESTLADPRAQSILQKLRQELFVVSPFRFIGRPVSISFPVANTATEVLHQVGEIPDGFLVLNADANIKRVPGKQFTKELAYLQADMVNATAVVVFGVFREESFNVNAQ